MEITIQCQDFFYQEQVIQVYFYLFMITRWAPDKDRVRSGRPKISAFVEAMRYHPVVESVNIDRVKSRGA